MRRNIRYAFLVMTVAIIGILIFQIYWISNSYDVARNSFEIEVNDALETVLNNDLRDKTLSRIFGVQEVPRDSVTQIIHQKSPSVLYQQNPDVVIEDSLLGSEESFSIEWNYQEYREEQYLKLGDDNKIDTLVISKEQALESWVSVQSGINSQPIFTIAPDDLYKVVGDVVISISEHRPDLKDLTQKYQEELAKRDIDIPFEMAFMDEDRLFEMTGNDAQVFQKAQAIQPIPGRYNEGDLIMAFFPKTNTFVLKTMWLTLVGSFLLVSLVAGSFILMLQTIIRQKKVSQVKNDFINNMTHEFKTPIATVSAAMEALVSFDGLADREKSLRYIDISRGEMDRLSILVEKVLNQSIFEEKKIILNKESFDVTKLLSSVAQQFRLKGGTQVTIVFDSDLPAFIHADKMHFQNVLDNLLDNAVKYSKDEVTINLYCGRAGDYVVIKVSDNGIGIGKDEQKHIFDKFYRVPTGDLHHVKGFGLGLNYVKHIVDLHGGTIGVQSTLGVGSEFTIAIPDIHE